jgi:DnaB-like helicase C terminal domain
MTTDYAFSLLCYLVQFPEGANYIAELEEDVFDLVEDKLTLQVLKKYYKLYQAVPSQTVAQQFLEEQIAQTTDLTREVAEALRLNFQDIYIPLPEGDKQNLQDTIILSIQEKNLEKTFMDFAANKISVNQVFTKLDRLSSLVKNPVSEFEDGGFLVQDRYKHLNDEIIGNPTFLHGLNTLTAAGGFYSPQLVIFMSGPKHFKTGIILRIGVEYARGGMKVYYADNENGVRSIRNRAKMAIMECELPDLFNPTMQDEINETLYRFGHYMKGDLFIDSYPAYSKSAADVKARLLQIKEKYKWEPDLIIWDTIDKFIPAKLEDRKRDTRIQIQKVYDEVINLNKELDVFSIAPSQVNRHAIGKKVFDIKDLSEDFAKAMNAHAIFAICATPEEEEAKIRRIVPVAQREGVRFKGNNMCVVDIDESTMKVIERDLDEYLKNVADD